MQIATPSLMPGRKAGRVSLGTSPLRVARVALHFRRDKLPPARSFYEFELGKLTRPNRKGWAQTRCPFHESKSGNLLGESRQRRLPLLRLRRKGRGPGFVSSP